MKFGHLLKTFEAEAEIPSAALLNYKKLKKLIKSHQKQKGEAADEAPAAVLIAASTGIVSSDEEGISNGTAAAAAEGTTAAAAAGAAAGAAVAAPAGGAVAAAAEACGGTQADGRAAALPAAAAAPAAGASEPAAGDGDQAGAGGVAEEDREFIHTLNQDLSRINTYFMECEEDAVIRLRALQDEHGAAGLASAELEQLRSEMVDFHGELVLLLHWSLVNYAAVAKILKKHDKLTGSRLRAPVLASVLHQPFLSTESISQLVKEAEQHVLELTQLCGGGGSAGAGAAAAEGSAEAHASHEAVAMPTGGAHLAVYKRTRAALHMLNDMQEGASTPSTLLPSSTANSDAAPDGKKLRTASQAEQARAHPEQPEQQPERLVVEAH